MNTIYTLGYQASTPDAVKRYVHGLDALLVDIRHAPFSRDPRWAGNNIMNWLGSPRYTHCPGYGNVNYRNGGSIRLFDPEAAAQRLGLLLERQNLILLCACATVETCHRKAAAEHLSAVTGAPVVHLPGKPASSLPENSIKALSLWQPWATLISIGAKRFETRSWSTNYRGRLAIHATKTLPVIARTLCRDDPFHEVLVDAGYPAVEDLPLGAVLCTVDLTDCTSTNGGLYLSRQERAFGDFSPDRFAWTLEDVERFPEPIPARGGQGLWTWTPVTHDKIAATRQED